MRAFQPTLNGVGLQAVGEHNKAVIAPASSKNIAAAHDRVTFDRASIEYQSPCFYLVVFVPVLPVTSKSVVVVLLGFAVELKGVGVSGAPVGEGVGAAAEQALHGVGADPGGVCAHDRGGFENGVGKGFQRAVRVAGLDDLFRGGCRADLDVAADRGGDDLDLFGDGECLAGRLSRASPVSVARRRWHDRVRPVSRGSLREVSHRGTA
jgi:hypothetical protein